MSTALALAPHASDTAVEYASSQSPPQIHRRRSFVAGPLPNKLGTLLFGALALFVSVLSDAHANLTQLTVTLTDPTGLPPPGPPFSFADTVSVVPGLEIFPGNA